MTTMVSASRPRAGGMVGWVLAIAGLTFVAAAGAARADDGFINVVKLSDTTMSIDLSIDGLTYSADLVQGPGDWATPEFQGFLFGLGTAGNVDNFSEGGFWIDPGAASGETNIKVIPSGNRFSVSFNINSDGDYPPFAAGGQCAIAGQAVPCPLLHNGETWHAPFAGPSGDGTVAITYTDRALGAPEPAGWALAIAGFGLAGAALRRRAASA